MKKIFLLLLITFSLISCNSTQNSRVDIENINSEKTEKINIVSSIIPLSSIVNYIAGDYANTKTLVPSGVSPHSFDLKPKQMIDIEKADLIIYLGEELEHIDGFLHKAIENKGNLLSVEDGIAFLESEEHEHSEHEDEHNENGHEDEHVDHEEEHHEEENHEEEHKIETHSIDPHIWGNSKNAIIIAENILNKISTIQPENKAYFEENFNSFKSELEKIKSDFESQTKEKKQNNFIVFHDAYNYLFEEIGIEESKKHIFRKNLLNDPNSSEMKNLIDEIKEENIKVAFKEPQLNASGLQKLASEYNLDINILNPLGIDDSKKGYIENYKNNLKSLEKIYE